MFCLTYCCCVPGRTPPQAKPSGWRPDTNRDDESLPHLNTQVEDQDQRIRILKFGIMRIFVLLLVVFKNDDAKAEWYYSVLDLYLHIPIDKLFMCKNVPVVCRHSKLGISNCLGENYQGRLWWTEPYFPLWEFRLAWDFFRWRIVRLGNFGLVKLFSLFVDWFNALCRTGAGMPVFNIILKKGIE